MMGESLGVGSGVYPIAQGQATKGTLVYLRDQRGSKRRSIAAGPRLVVALREAGYSARGDRKYLASAFGSLLLPEPKGTVHPSGRAEPTRSVVVSSISETCQAIHRPLLFILLPMWDLDRRPRLLPLPDARPRSQLTGCRLVSRHDASNDRPLPCSHHRSRWSRTQPRDPRRRPRFELLRWRPRWDPFQLELNALKRRCSRLQLRRAPVLSFHPLPLYRQWQLVVELELLARPLPLPLAKW
ncbi:hypothetical protein BD311DRAFT_80122 [Dichomitus squalens]|uniref:Uncharacterized protein n=1 Tax=Dichomitus squalens TaxID=114155 RepID=A0A4Q9MV93_9APHY|nr:hypothetical protein BD311DRAFT_80122 [Dichomitus squalens]